MKVAAAKAERARGGSKAELARADSVTAKSDAKPDMTPTATTSSATGGDAKEAAATSTIANWMGFKKPEEAKVAEPVPAEPVTASVPLPQKRGAAGKASKAEASKPQASKGQPPKPQAALTTPPDRARDVVALSTRR